MLKRVAPSLPFKNYKSCFYQKSLVLRTDYGHYNRYFKLWHPRYYDVNRRTEYQKNKRDYKKLQFNSMDPLHFDYEFSKWNGGFERVKYETLN